MTLRELATCLVKMDLQSQFLNCSDLPQVHQLQKANLINTVFTTTSLLIQLVLLALLVLYKACKTTLQRLFLYLTLFTALNTIVLVCNVELQFDIGPDFCAWIGFFTVWTDFLIELFSISLTCYLIAVTLQKLKGKQLCSYKKILCSKRQKILIEVVCTCLLVCLPLILVTWWPYKYHLYGKGETVCWIKSRYDNCIVLNDSKITSAIEILETTLHSTVIVSFMALVLTFSLMLIKLRRSRAHNYQAMGRAIFLTVIISISMFYRISHTIVNQLYGQSVDAFLYPLINNSVYVLVNVLVPLGFGMYLYSPSKLRIKYMKKAAKKWPCYCSKKQPDLLMEEDGPESLEDSVVRNVPSHTTYTSPHSSPYTNEFTVITEIVSSQECNITPHYGTIN